MGTKRKKRRTLVTTIIVANCHRQLKSLEMTNDDCRSLSKTALHMMKKLLLLIADARFKAKIICQGEDCMFFDWVRAHVHQFPQDRPLLSDFISETSDTSGDFAKIDELIDECVNQKKKAKKALAEARLIAERLN